MWILYILIGIVIGLALGVVMLYFVLPRWK